jgi:hypothetical protein
MAALGYATRPINMTSSGELTDLGGVGQQGNGEGGEGREGGEGGEGRGEDEGVPNSDEWEVKVEEVEMEVEAETDGEGVGFQCQIRGPGDEVCGKLLDSRGVSLYTLLREMVGFS